MNRFLRYLALMVGVAFFTLPVAQQAEASVADSISIRLFKEIAPRTIVVSGSGPISITSDDHTQPIETLKKRERFTITTNNNQLYLRLGDHTVYALSIRIHQPAGEEMGIEVAEANTRGNRAAKAYRGSLYIGIDPADPSQLRILNYVDVNDYIKGVLASEFNFRREREATRAMAIAVRTQAYRALRQNGPAFDLPDTDIWQVYGGNEGITKVIEQSVEETQDLVLTYNGDLIEAVYSASSGGHTANNEDVWNASSSLPYLRGQIDPYDENAPYHSWATRIPKLALHRTLGDALQFQVQGVHIMDRSKDGRARTIEVVGPSNERRTLRGNNFRSIINRTYGKDELKSTLFEMSPAGSDYVFRGNGFGHGVGLSQWGALEMSKRGHNYQEILDFYYPNTIIEPYLEFYNRYDYNNTNYGYGVQTASRASDTPSYQDDRYRYNQSGSQNDRSDTFTDDEWLDEDYAPSDDAWTENLQDGGRGWDDDLRDRVEETGNWFTRLFRRNRNTSSSPDPLDFPSDSNVDGAAQDAADVGNQLFGEGGDSGSQAVRTNEAQPSSRSTPNSNMKGWSSPKRSKSDATARAASSSSSKKRAKRTKRIGW